MPEDNLRIKAGEEQHIKKNASKREMLKNTAKRYEAPAVLSNQTELFRLRQQTEEDEQRTHRAGFRSGSFENKYYETDKQDRQLVGALTGAQDEKVYFGHSKEKNEVVAEVVSKEKKPLKGSEASKPLDARGRFSVKKQDSDKDGTTVVTTRRTDEAHVGRLVKDMLRAGDESRSFQTVNEALTPMNTRSARHREQMIREELGSLNQTLTKTENADIRTLLHEEKSELHHLFDRNLSLDREKEALERDVTNRLIESVNRERPSPQGQDEDDLVALWLKRRREEAEEQPKSESVGEEKKGIQFLRDYE